MKVSTSNISLSDIEVDVLVAPLAAGGVPDPIRKALGDAYERAAADFSADAAETLLLYPAEARAKRALLVGLGEASGVDAEALRVAGAAGARVAAERQARTVAITLPSTPVDAEAAAQALVEGFVLASYRFTRYKTDGEDAYAGPDRLVLHAEGQEKVSRRGAERGRVVAEAVATARDLVNLSPDEKTPALLSKAIQKSAKKHGYEVDVWTKSLIEDEGMGGLLAVNRGSVEPPTFNVLTWQPEGAPNERPVVLVGKGVVYDTGGLSLKPTEGMTKMKSDMAGAAAVVGAFEAIARLGLSLYVVGLIPASDNRPGENAYVPGDVVRMHSGATVEVLNTDAEGRMLLADALSYAKTYGPPLVVDLATLTGAAVVALGHHAAAAMTADDDGAADRLGALQAAGDRAGERVHPLPLYKDYKEQLKSEVADLKNVGGRAAGSITAGKFLEHFTDYPWLHVDIAGMAWTDEARPYAPKGGTGYGVRLLVEFLRDYADPRKRM